MCSKNETITEDLQYSSKVFTFKTLCPHKLIQFEKKTTTNFPFQERHTDLFKNKILKKRVCFEIIIKYRVHFLFFLCCYYTIMDTTLINLTSYTIYNLSHRPCLNLWLAMNYKTSCPCGGFQTGSSVERNIYWWN